MTERTTVRDLHRKPSELIRRVGNGETIVIEKDGSPVAELRPVDARPAGSRLPDREKMMRRLPRVKIDSGRILEEDRS